MCVCMKTTFRQWLALKKRNGWSFEQAAEETRCGVNCETCQPYLRVVEATGQTELPILQPEEFDLILSEEEQP